MQTSAPEDFVMHRSMRTLLSICLLGALSLAQAQQATLVPAYGPCKFGWIEWDLSWGILPVTCCGWLYHDNDLVARAPADPNFFAPTPQWYVFLEDISDHMCIPVVQNRQYGIRRQVQHPTDGWYYLQGSTNLPFLGGIRCNGNP
jgi:hypothetical protein